MEDAPIKPRLWDLFITFFSVSALTIGGGYAMIPVFADKIVKKKWMDEKEFYDLFALGQAIPGPMALNTAVIAGNRLRSLPGAIVSFFAVMIPPFVTIILVSLIFVKISEITFVQGFLKGSYGVVIGLVAAMIFKMLKNRKWSAGELIIVLLGAAALFLFMNYSLPIFIAIALLCYTANRNGAKQV
jgi:chromate transporter